MEFSLNHLRKLYFKQMKHYKNNTHTAKQKAAQRVAALLFYNEDSTGERGVSMKTTRCPTD